MTRRSRAFAGTALIAFAFALATPLGGSAVGRACAAGNVHIAVVVDSGSGSTVSAVCVPGNARDNGATILAARASLLGTPQPRYNASGLLCAIDGLPQSGCGEQKNNGRYAYWSYFHGSSGKWSYSSFGPGSWRVDPGTVEGWRWQPDGSGLPNDPAPRGPASVTAICIPQAPPTTARAVASGTTAPHAGVTTPAVTPGATTVIGPAGTGTAPANGGPNPSTKPTTNPSPRATTVTTARGHPSTTVADDAASRSTTSSISLTTGGIAAPPGTQSSGGGSGGAPVGAILGVLLLIGLGAGGAIAARRRSRPAS